MLSLQTLRDDPASVIARLGIKNLKQADILVHEILEKDELRRKIIVELEEARAKSNTLAKSIGQMMAQGQKEAAEAAKAETSGLKEQIKTFEEQSALVESELQNLMVQLPNLPHDSVPHGHSAESNTITFRNSIEVTLFEGAKPHWELCKSLGLIDFETGVKITGAGFPVYTGKGARLQRALINFFLDEATKAGYTEIQPPILINADSGFGTGQLPDKEGQMYFVQEDGLYLIPTAEVPITNIYRDTILEEKQLPVKNCGYTPCFRREAGSYGKDVRGLNRLHQFDKVEIVQLAAPEYSYSILEEMSLYVQSLLEKLELPFRVALLCGGDMSFASAKTYDMEVWSAAQERWLEVSSVSNFEGFQANRLKLRIRDENRKIRTAHTLNGSALALPRIVAALLENNQQKDGSIMLPKVLHAYCGFDRIS
jgi:seryl-tRNA synthetase